MRTRIDVRYVLIGALTACSASDSSPSEVFDTSGARFAWVCTEHCLPEITDGTPPLPACNVGTPLYAWAINRFINIDAACAHPDGGWSSSANRERPLACHDTFDCPQFTTGTYECRSGLCQNANTEKYPLATVTWSEAYTLCYAPFAREATIDPLSDTAQQVYAWVQQACPTMGGVCALPLPGMCMQP